MNKILRNTKINGNLLPVAINTVYSIPEEYIYSKNYFLRHPKIILFKSIDRIIKAFIDVIDLNDKIVKDLKLKKTEVHPEFNKLSKSIVELLDSINSLIEDCLSIFKTTTPPTEVIKKNKRKFVYQWLEKSKHPTYLSFYDKVKSYRNEITYFINKHKHEHGRIEIVPGIINNNECILGYTMKYIDDISGEVLEVLDLNKIKSISLDIQYNFYQFYNICEHFSSALLESIKIFHKTELVIKNIDIKLDTLNYILPKIHKNELFVFPNNELFEPKVYTKYDEGILEINYPVGITEENSQFIIKSPIKGKPSPRFSVILVPTETVVEQFKTFQNSQKKTKMRLSLTDEDKYFLKIFFEQNKIINEKKETINYFELNYQDFFLIKAFSNIELPITFEGGMIADKLHIKIFEIDYAGIKMAKE